MTGFTSASTLLQESNAGSPAAEALQQSHAAAAQHVIALDSDQPSSDPFETMKTPPPKTKQWKQFKTRTPVRPLAGSDRNDTESVADQTSIEERPPQEGRTTAQDCPNGQSITIEGGIQIQGRADSPLNLDQAPARRKDWTPPNYKGKAIATGEDSKQEFRHLEQSQEDSGQSFNKLLEAYKFADDSADGPTAPEGDSSVFRKRKLIECVSVKANTETTEPEAAPVKRKATKKKPRTITALATAAYKPATQVDPEPQPTDACKAKPETETAAKPNGKANAKPRRKTAKQSKKKAAPPKPVLLSPNAALRQVANQDFVFGTSSQLAGDHSPRFLRDLATALRRSNQRDTITNSTPINSDSIEPPEHRQSLWDAAARDEDGDLFDVGVRELADGAVEMPPCVKQTDPFGYVKDTDGRDENSFLNLSDILEQSAAELEESDLPSLSKSPDLICVDSSPMQEMSQKEQPGLSQAVLRESVRPSVPNDEVADVAPTVPRPKFELYTDAQLSREVASYGFKNIKPRNAQIALLDRCWKSKTQLGGSASSQRHASTLSSAASIPKGKAATAASPTKTPIRTQSSVASALEPQEPPPSAQPTESPKRRPGRPRKTASDTPAPTKRKASQKASSAKPRTKAAAPTTPKNKGRASKVVVEIPDSESEAAEELSDVSASPPCSTVDDTFSPSRAVDMSVSMDEDTEISISVSPSDQPASFGYIKKAITTAPRTTDPLHPSWHEKMLMYDPIVVEDLAAWLNAGELTRVGYDDEVSSGEVKKWCESKSICCLWKVNLRGKERKRF